MTIEELEEQRRVAVEKVQAIEAHFAIRKPVPGQKRTAEYQKWKASAVTALKYALKDVARLKGLIKEARKARSVATEATDLSTPGGLIHAAHNLLHRLNADGVDFDPDELQVMFALERWLNHKTEVKQECPRCAGYGHVDAHGNGVDDPRAEKCKACGHVNL